MTVDAIADVFADASVTGSLHARLVGQPTAPTVGWRAAEPVAMASVYKLPVAVAWARMVDRGEIDPRSRVRLDRSGRTDGPTGLSLLLDPVEMSARDLVRLMLTVSDNAAADAVLATVGLPAVNAMVQDLGLTSTVVRSGAAATVEQVQDDTGAADFAAALRALAALDREVRTSAYDPALSSSTTAADMTALLAQLWTWEGSAAALVRTSMAQQASRHRLGSGFPHDDVVVAGKTGTLGTLRHEVGVVTFPHEVPVAVAVFTQSARAERHLPRVDAAVGAAARLAAAALRRQLAD